MPELPEVEITSRGIKKYLTGEVITGWVFRHTKLRWPIPIKQLQSLVGQTIQSVSRRGKYIIVGMQNSSMLIHLGMSGRLHILAKNTPPNKHDHVDLNLSNGFILRLTDPRRFGAWLFTDEDVNLHPLIRKLGVEPLTDLFSADYLYQKAQRRKINIKAFIMDSHVVVGVGNIYANEALFSARINPLLTTDQLTLTQAKALVPATKKILKNAIQHGGTTLKDFLQADGKPGYFSIKLLAYGRAGEPCVNCKTLLKSMRQQQRITVYCPFCQN